MQASGLPNALSTHRVHRKATRGNILLVLTLAYYLAVIVVALALVGGHIAFWGWFYARRRDPDERHFVRTEDGWTLALSRIRPRSGPAEGTPVICAPGLACNSRMFDFEKGRSLARYLSNLGFDVWLLDYRGLGESQRPRFLERGWRFGFEDYAQTDGVAALQRVLAETGHDRVLWVGHSMGGLVGYQVATHEACGAHLAGVVALGSPADFSQHEQNLGWVTLVLDRFLRGWPVVRLGRLGNLLAPFAGHLRTFPEPLFLSVRNTEGRVLRHFMVEVLEDVPRRLLDQFADNILRRLGFDGQPVSRTHDRLGSATVPLLSVAGNVDQIAPPESVHAAVQLLGSEDCTEITVGSGEVVGFGHLDLVLGRRAPELVYPQVADWLLEHA